MQCDANPEVSKVAVMEDKYENIVTLITYYQMVSKKITVLSIHDKDCAGGNVNMKWCYAVTSEIRSC